MIFLKWSYNREKKTSYYTYDRAYFYAQHNGYEKRRT
jgi:hypothetical protein